MEKLEVIAKPWSWVASGRMMTLAPGRVARAEVALRRRARAGAGVVAEDVVRVGVEVGHVALGPLLKDRREADPSLWEEASGAPLVTHQVVETDAGTVAVRYVQPAVALAN